MNKVAEKVMQELLELYDWHVRLTNPKDADDYQYGYADGIGQCVLNIGKALGENNDFSKPYKFEVYKRVMEYDTTANYWKKYPKPLADYFPADTIRRNGGSL